MARPLDPRIRTRLRDAAVDYVLSHGFVDLALRPLAKALKTSARMLLYHFGSREALMREILTGLREREGRVIRDWLGRKKKRSPAEFLDWYWKRLSSSKARPAVRLTFELYGLALRDPSAYPGVLTDPINYWKGLTPDDARATLLLAVTRGLLLDLCATEDRKRVQDAMDLLCRLLQQAA